MNRADSADSQSGTCHTLPLSTETSNEPLWIAGLSGCLIGLVFLSVSLFSSPIPGVNEPHYLCKARAFDNPDWCSRDFFLSSSNAHYWFFAGVGCLTRWFSLDTIALLGRAVSAILLAAAWTTLGRTLGLSATIRVVSACLFATISQLGNFSGEWLLGGFEAKVPAWGLCLIAVSFWIRGQVRCCPGWMTGAGVVCGLGCSLHPVVGGWVAVCLCMAGAWNIVVARLENWACAWRFICGANNVYGTSGILKQIGGIVLFAAATMIVALPGLLPVLRLVLDRSTPERDRDLASFYQVFWRLRHHLDPTEFMPSQWIFAASLLVVIIAVDRISRRNDRTDSLPEDPSHLQSSLAWSRLLAVFGMSVLIAVAGTAAGWHTIAAQDMKGWEWRASLLKFYPFRAFDALLPIVAAMAVGRLMQLLVPGLHEWSVRRRSGIVVAAIALPLALAWHGRETTPPGYTTQQFAEWRDACRWIRENTPTDSLILTPRESFAFKWMAERAEYVCYKDCPQDTAGILTWNKRLWLLHDWTKQSSSDGRYDANDLRTLRRQTGCDFIVTRQLGPFDAEPLWQGREWRIYRVPG